MCVPQCMCMCIDALVRAQHNICKHLISEKTKTNHITGEPYLMTMPMSVQAYESAEWVAVMTNHWLQHPHVTWLCTVHPACNYDVATPLGHLITICNLLWWHPPSKIHEEADRRSQVVTTQCPCLMIIVTEIPSQLPSLTNDYSTCICRMNRKISYILKSFITQIRFEISYTLATVLGVFSLLFFWHIHTAVSNF